MNRISLLFLLLCLSWSAQAQVLNNSVIQVGATPSGSCTQGEPSRQVPSGSGGTIYDCVAGSWSARGGGGGSAAGSSGDYQINNGGSFGAGVLAQSSGRLTATPTAASSGVASFFRLITPADTTQTASTESIGAQFGGNTSAATVTRQWAAGALATQRENLFVAPTYAFAGASTLTTAATVAINAAPVAGTNATITNSYALLVQAGKSYFGGDITIAGTSVPLAISNASNASVYVQFYAYGNTSGYVGYSSYDSNGVGIYDNYGQSRTHTIANLLQVKGDTGVRIGAAAPSSGQTLQVDAKSSSSIGALILGAASNSAAILVSKSGSSGTGDLWQGQNSSGTVLAAITSTGRFQVGASGAPVILSGSGSPESSITAPVGSLYLRTDGGAGTSFCVKESGSGNTGWVCK